jgi:hypothetical protein
MKDTRFALIAGFLATGWACDQLQPVELNEFIPDSGIDAPVDADTEGIDTDADAVAPIDPNNATPRANAGSDQYDLLPGDLVQLDGSGSSDLDDDPLDFEWRIVTRPAGSVATVTNPDFVTAQVYVDRAGLYEIELLVSDGVADDMDVVKLQVDEANQPPRADAGLDARVSKGAVVQLSGSASSDPEGDTLEYYWEFVNRPPSSSSTLTNTSVQPAVAPRFTADQAGVFTMSLVVSDGMYDSAPDLVSITVEDPNSGVGSGGGTSSGTDCLSCSSQVERELAQRWSAGDAASSLGLLSLPFLTLFWQRRREEDDSKRSARRDNE